MTTSNKPVWLLDIDGVINAVVIPHKFPRIFAEDSWRYHVSHTGFKIHYSTTVVEFINSMSERVNVRWHTTWQKEALRLGQDIGLKEFPVSESDFHVHAKHAEFDWWKMGAAIRVVNNEKRPLIWSDDDLVMPEERRTFIDHTARTPDVPALLVVPDWRTGLNQENLDAIEEFVKEAEASAQRA